MTPNHTDRSLVCPPGLILPFMDENGWNPTVRGVLYFIALIYAFIGVSVVTDIFMGAVLTITSRTKKVSVAKSKAKKNPVCASSGSNRASLPKDEEPEFVEVRVWNDTVANLTLMALGTSAPEILLACVEIVGHQFESRELGPSTIVGSGAFNLLVITSICMMSIPKGESRKIRLFKVFMVCSMFSIFAYVWLWAVLALISPHVVELWEAIVTFLMFPFLVIFAYFADRGRCLCPFRSKTKRQLEIEGTRSEESEKMFIERQFFRGGKMDKESLVAFMRELKKYSNLSDEDTAILAASKIMEAQPRSAVHYRIGAVRELTGGRKTHPKLSTKLREVYDSMNRSNAASNSGLRSDFSIENRAIVEFQTATCAVPENIGSFHVSVWRHGNLNTNVSVRVRSLDGSAKTREDYEKIDEILTFEPGESEKQVLVRIIDDNNWEPDEEFFLKLTLVEGQEKNLVQLGKISIMEITILDDDRPGVISFDKRGIVVKESADAALIQVRRKFGADGDVSVKWRTIDDSAVSGKDFVGGEGVLVFKHREVLKTLEIPIINKKQEKDKFFEVELMEPNNNASLGQITRVWVTVTNDDAFSHIIDRLMVMTTANVESLGVYRKTWVSQMKDAMNVNGGDVKNAGAGDYILHLISFNWKVLFSLIPPPNFFGGWLSFVISLAAIGFVTALIGDIASTFGCIVGMADSTTAITLVAMGTSLPDTFASRMAALREQYADTAIGNIMGSNSVNVFLGLGLPWLMASIYHASQGKQFRVPSSSLGFNVLIFSFSAVIVLFLLVLRRHFSAAGKAELGGPVVFKVVCGAFLFMLWLLYVLLSSFQEYGCIKLTF